MINILKNKTECEQVKLHLGDCIEVLKSFADNSVDSIVTDPPYGLSFMGKKWDYDVPSVDIWRECLRVLKPGGHLLAFAGTRTQHRMAVRIEDAGFEIRDMIAWIYGSGFPKSLNLGKQGGPEGWGTALKPAIEPITVARKPIAPKHTVAQNVQAFGTGALNIDASRIEADMSEHIRKDHTSKSDSIGYGSESWIKKGVPHTQGRWPANILFDEEASAILDGQSDVKLGASRFFYVAKASKAERNAGCEGMPEKSTGQRIKAQSAGRKDEGKQESSFPQANHHPTVKPVKLMEYLVRLTTPPNGTVLDPFMGSGSTGVAAIHEGFQFVGIERDQDYLAIAGARIEAAVASLKSKPLVQSELELVMHP